MNMLLKSPTYDYSPNSNQPNQQPAPQNDDPQNNNLLELSWDNLVDNDNFLDFFAMGEDDKPKT